MTSIPLRRVVALAASVAVIAWAVELPVAVAGSALFNGRVVSKDGFAPRGDVVVALVDPQTEATFSSQPTGEDGTFRIDGAPAGTYAVLARTVEGTYLATDALELDEGTNPPLQLALDPGARPTLVPGQTSDEELPNWAKGVVAGLLLIGSYVLWDNITEDQASEDQPF